MTLSPGDPQPVLSAAKSCIRLAMSKPARAPSRHATVLQAFALLSAFCDHFGEGDPVPAYNTGRAYQEVDMVHLAVPQYERCLELCEARAGGGGEDDGWLRELAARNLAQIYRGSGNDPLAREVLARHAPAAS